MKFINLTFLRFVVAGGVNTLLGYLLYLVLILFINYPLAYTISYVLGIYIAYFLNSVFVFNAKMSLLKALKYPLVYLFQFLAGLILLNLLVEVLGVSEVIAPVLVIVITLPFTFLLSRFILKPTKTNDEAVGGSEKL